jgi:hypothetical protein
MMGQDAFRLQALIVPAARPFSHHESASPREFFDFAHEGRPATFSAWGIANRLRDFDHGP